MTETHFIIMSTHTSRVPGHPLPAQPPAPSQAAPACPVRWTCPVCRASVAQGQSHPHLTHVVGLGLDRGQAQPAPRKTDPLAALARHPAIAAVDIVRTDDGRTFWLAWGTRPTAIPGRSPATPRHSELACFAEDVPGAAPRFLAEVAA